MKNVLIDKGLRERGLANEADCSIPSVPPCHASCRHPEKGY